MASFDWSKFTEKDYNELLELIGSGNREKLNAEKDKWTVTSGKFSFVFDIYCDEKDGKYYLDAEVYEEELIRDYLSRTVLVDEEIETGKEKRYLLEQLPKSYDEFAQKAEKDMAGFIK